MDGKLCFFPDGTETKNAEKLDFFRFFEKINTAAKDA